MFSIKLSKEGLWAGHQLVATIDLGLSALLLVTKHYAWLYVKQTLTFALQERIKMKNGNMGLGKSGSKDGTAWAAIVVATWCI